MLQGYLNELLRWENALFSRNPEFRNFLNPGIFPEQVKKRLESCISFCSLTPLVALYSWKNGTRQSANLTLLETSLFPGEIYQFIDLETAIAHWQGFQLVKEFHPVLSSRNIELYFPIFWDNSTGYIVVNLTPPCDGGVFILEFESPAGLTKAYPTFNDFLQDAIRANLEQNPMKCFE